jgi:hypothetical protein
MDGRTDVYDVRTCTRTARNTRYVGPIPKMRLRGGHMVGQFCFTLSALWRKIVRRVLRAAAGAGARGSRRGHGPSLRDRGSTQVAQHGTAPTCGRNAARGGTGRETLADGVDLCLPAGLRLCESRNQGTESLSEAVRMKTEVNRHTRAHTRAHNCWCAYPGQRCATLSLPSPAVPRPAPHWTASQRTEVNHGMLEDIRNRYAIMAVLLRRR